MGADGVMRPELDNFIDTPNQFELDGTHRLTHVHVPSLTRL